MCNLRAAPTGTEGRGRAIGNEGVWIALWDGFVVGALHTMASRRVAPSAAEPAPCPRSAGRQGAAEHQQPGGRAGAAAAGVHRPPGAGALRPRRCPAGAAGGCTSPSHTPATAERAPASRLPHPDENGRRTWLPR